jgi:hypothetical protein
MKELKHGAGLVVFDQDMPGLKGRVAESREKIFSLLRAERRQQRQLAVIIIKDFDQGSLFGDMVTMAKDVSNAMLSPVEFLEFMRNYLCDFHTAHATWRVRIGNATGLAHSTYGGRPSVSLGLADIKSAFQLSQDRGLWRIRACARTNDCRISRPRCAHGGHRMVVRPPTCSRS